MRRYRSNPKLALTLAAVFAAGALLVGSLAYRAVRDLVVAWRVPGLENTAPFQPRPLTTEAEAIAAAPPLDATVPLQPTSGPPSLPWDGESRINILLMGVDRRAWEEGGGPPRTDTLILLTLDPRTRTAGMLSLPRDLWVEIPGYDYGKINTAFLMGELEHLPGGGAGLAMATVQSFLTVPVEYYVAVDFTTFVRFIDEIGGVKLDVPEVIEVDPLGPGNVKKLQPGLQTLPGDVALAYARARNTSGGDFDRAQRQQQVLMAIQTRLLSFDLIPVLINKAPLLYQELANGFVTNLTLEQLVRIALVFQGVAAENIHHRVVGMDDVTYGSSPEGLFILKPLPERIRLLRDEVFTSGEEVVLVQQNKSQGQLVTEEAAQIAVLNATYQPGLASRTTEFLENKALSVVLTDNATQYYEYTTVIDYTGNPYTLQYLTELMGIQPNRIFHSYDPESQVDIEINLGDDWAKSGTLP